MAKISYHIFSFIFLLSSLISAQRDSEFSRSLPPSSLGLGKENLTHLRFYFHDTVSGNNPTSVRVAEAPTTNSSASGFGAVAVADVPLTRGPETNSTLVGRAQGMYAFASQSEMAVIMMINFAFSEGRYNGSTITVMGRNIVLSARREMPIVGGSGLFRFARGYVELRTISDDSNTGDNVVEYNAYVIHY